MALIKCKNCGHMISDRASTCPHCGHKQKEQACSENRTGKHANNINNEEPIKETLIEGTDEHHTNKTLVILIGVLVVIAIGFGSYMFCINGNQNTDFSTLPDTLTNDSTIVDTVKSDTETLEKPIEVIVTQNAIGTIRKGMLAKIAVPMLADPSAKGDFYDRVEIEETDRYITDICYEVFLYKGKEKLCSFTTDAKYNLSNDAGIPSKKVMGNGRITAFSIYSPSIKLKDGIHVGLTAKELVEKYHAKIRHYENLEYGGLEFVFNKKHKGYSFIAKGEIINSNMESDIDDSEEEFLNLSDVRDCSLKQIDF